MLSKLSIVFSDFSTYGKHFIKQCDLAEDKIIRAGYPCCFYPGKIKTYDHDILKQKKLPEDTKIAVYAPTYRDASATNFFLTGDSGYGKVSGRIGEK